jgi:hypothetical protein
MAIDGAAWLGFGGVVVGAAVGYASSAVQESARRRHERQQARANDERDDRIRFENRRFDAYVAVMNEANRVYSAVRYPTVARSSGSDHDAFVAQLNAAYEHFRATLGPAFVLATSVEMRDRLSVVARATAELLASAVASPGVLLPGDAFSAHRSAVRAAEAAMRVELGLVPAQADQPDE